MKYKVGLKRIAREERKRRRLGRRLGVDDPVCGICGFEGVFAFETDHDVGRAYSDTTIILCANCHKQKSAYQYDYPSDEQDPLTRYYRRLRANVDLIGMMLEGIYADLQRLDILGGD